MSFAHFILKAAAIVVSYMARLLEVDPPLEEE